MVFSRVKLTVLGGNQSKLEHLKPKCSFCGHSQCATQKAGKEFNALSWANAFKSANAGGAFSARTCD